MGENGDKTLSRPDVLRSLKLVLDFACEKLENRKTPRRDRLAWSRIIASCAAASSSLLRDADLEELMDRLDKVEEAFKQKG